MKGLGKAAIVFTIIFLVFVIAGSVLLAASATAGDFDRIRDSIPWVHWGGRWDRQSGEWIDVSDRTQLSFSNKLVSSGDFDTIVVDSLLPYALTIESGNVDGITITFSGELPTSLANRHCLSSTNEFATSLGGTSNAYEDAQEVSPADVMSDSDEQLAPPPPEVSEELEMPELPELPELQPVPGGDGEPSSPIRFSLAGDKLRIEMANIIGSYSWRGDIRGSITITIPSDYTGALEILDTIGDAKVNMMKCDKLAVSSCVGQMRVTGSYDRMDISDIMGQLDIDSTGTPSMLEIRSITGRVDLSGPVAGLSIDDCLGRVDIESSTGLTVNSKVTSVMGDVTLRFPSGTALNVTQHDVFGSVSSRVSGGEGPTLSVSDVLGSVTVGYSF